MDRAEAIKVLSEWVATGANGDKSCTVSLGVNIDTIDSVFDMAIAALREQERNEQDCAKDAHCNEWISVKERLPESDTRVLVWLGNGGGDYTQMDTDRLHLGRRVRWDKNVTHWMPLPEPPKEGADHE